jgi:hypothetical protein
LPQDGERFATPKHRWSARECGRAPRDDERSRRWRAYSDAAGEIVTFCWGVRLPGIGRRQNHCYVGRPWMRVLFFAYSHGVALRYASLVSELSERGHEVHLAFDSRFGGLPRRRLPPRASTGVEPERPKFDGWRSIAWLVRAIGDLARYAHPRYARADVLRSRMRRLVLDRVERSGEFEPIARWFALRVARELVGRTDAELSERVICAAARLEAAIPTSRRVDRYIRNLRPDVVLVSPVVRMGSSQIEFLKSARRLGIPAATCVASWDNLTNKGLLRLVPERVFVWNETQRREAIELHGAPSSRVVATGAQLFDDWFEQRPRSSRGEFMRRLGLDPTQPYVLFLGSSPFVAQGLAREVRFVTHWIETLRTCDNERLRRIGIVIRPHPTGRRWPAVDLDPFENVVIWPRRPVRPVTSEEQGDFFDSLAHSHAVVGINTTAMIEAAIVGKSVLTILDQKFAQESTLHFHYLLEENGGFLHVASSLDEHVGQLARVLDDGDRQVEQRARFIESFVRPHGLHRPATPILADAVEALAGARVETTRYSRRLRLMLLLDVPLSALALVVYPVRRRLRHRRQRARKRSPRAG